MFTLKLLSVSLVFGSVFLLTAGLLDLGSFREDGRFEWAPRVDTAGLERLASRAWNATSSAIGDAIGAARENEQAPAPQVTEQILVLH